MEHCYGTLLLVTLFLIIVCQVCAQSDPWYSCSNKCDGADRNYNLYARYGKYPIIHRDKGIHEVFHTRSWEGDDEESQKGIFGPTIKVKPGESLNIKVWNQFAAEGLPPKPPKPEDWIPLIEGRYGNLHNIILFNKMPQSIDDMVVHNHSIPQNFDDINLHVHGLHVETHMYHPMGTHDPRSPTVRIQRGECYCYEFHVPKDQEPGTFFYHPHSHGAVGLHGWSGMAGVIIVEGGLDYTLPKLGIERDLMFGVWDPHFVRHEDGFLRAKSSTLEVDDYLRDQTDQAELYYMVNGNYQPIFNMNLGEIVRLRVLCATSENLMSFTILDHEQRVVPYYVVALDGINIDKPRKVNNTILGGGQRQDVLLQFKTSGIFNIWSRDLDTIQFFGTGPKDTILATVNVSSVVDPLSKVNPMDVDTVTGGNIPEPINCEHVVARRSFTYDLFTNRRSIPFPQFVVNGLLFNSSRVDANPEFGTSEEWVLINPAPANHPVHLHVNSFELVELVSPYKYQGGQAQRFFESVDQWKGLHRDTVIVPPLGYARIRIRFDKWTGLTFSHCHFNAHSDTGMLTVIDIREPSKPYPKKYPESVRQPKKHKSRFRFLD